MLELSLNLYDCPEVAYSEKLQVATTSAGSRRRIFSPKRVYRALPVFSPSVWRYVFHFNYFIAPVNSVPVIIGITSEVMVQGGSTNGG
jgi:hypothetical protein